jgi:uncharacterized protein with HEPN domain
MRSDPILLLDIVGAARNILEFVEGMTYADFRTDKLVQRAVILEFLVLGEAASRLSAETKAAHPAIEWGPMVGMRNQLIHGYFSIDLELVWKTTQRDLVPLIAALEGSIPPEEDPPDVH